MTTDAARRQLDEQGYVLLEGFMLSRASVCSASCGGGFSTSSKRKAIAPVTSSRPKQPLAVSRTSWTRARSSGGRLSSLRLLDCVRHVLGPRIKLSSLNARSADPHSSEGQPLHVDMSAVPDDQGYWVCNTVWLLDDFTAENGATRMVPGSHKWGTRPQDVLDDPMAPHPDEVLLLGRAGDVAVMNAHLWHGGTANRTAAPRLAMHAFYCRRDKPQQQYQKVAATSRDAGRAAARGARDPGARRPAE